MPAINRVVDGGASGYRHGGYVYIRPHEDEDVPRIITHDQARYEVQSFTDQLDPHPWAADKWKPYFEKLPVGPSKVAMDGLRVAINHMPDSEPTVAGIITKRSSSRAFVANLSKHRGLESWHRKNDRGVIRLSAMLFLANIHHDSVFGNTTGITDIDTKHRTRDQEMPVDCIDYLPHIDGTTHYSVRRRGLDVVAIGGAARPLLVENGFGHIWERYITSTRS